MVVWWVDRLPDTLAPDLVARGRAHLLGLAREHDATVR